MTRKIILICASIAAFAFLFRVYGLKDRYIFDHDDIVYYHATIEAGNSISKYLTKESDSSFTESLLPVTDVFAAKPGRIFLGLFSLRLLGDSHFSFLLGIALWGVLSVILLFWMGRKLYGTVDAIRNPLQTQRL